MSGTIAKHEYYYENDIVDWSKPLLGQVELLGDRYFEWTHKPVDRPIRLFESTFAEIASKAYWWFVPVIWIPISLYNIWASFKILSHSPEVWPSNALGCRWEASSIPLLLVIGVIFWTLLEYVIHRWLFHLRPPSNYPLLIRLHFALHGQHHKSPMDPMRLVFPPLPASVFGLCFFMACVILFPRGVAMGIYAGIVLGYVVYDTTHYYIHHGQPFLAYFKQLKTYHTKHHYQHQEFGFGISSKLWDYPFGTLIPENLEQPAEKVK